MIHKEKVAVNKDERVVVKTTEGKLYSPVSETLYDDWDQTVWLPIETATEFGPCQCWQNCVQFCQKNRIHLLVPTDLSVEEIRGLTPTEEGQEAFNRDSQPRPTDWWDEVNRRGDQDNYKYM